MGNSNSGLYLLLIKLSQKNKITVRSGKVFNMLPGFYIYIGSAKKNLSQRLKRHASKYKKLFWHIDFLLEKSELLSEFIIKDEKNECRLAERISNMDGALPVKGFGCSDCKCESHLYYFREKPGKIEY